MDKDGYLIVIPRKVPKELEGILTKSAQIKSSIIDLLNEIYGIIDSTYKFNNETIKLLYDNLESIFDRPLLLSSFLVRDATEKDAPKRIIEDIYRSVMALAKKCTTALSEHLLRVIDKIGK